MLEGHDGDPPSTARQFFERGYWTFLRTRAEYAARAQPIIRYWPSRHGLNDVERHILDVLAPLERVLDVGAGDLEVKRRLQMFGLPAEYRTLDPTKQFQHDYADLAEVPAHAFDAVIALEVIEHIRLEEVFEFVAAMAQKLRNKGTLIISTPNPDYVGSTWSADFTHVHAYRGPDLAALLDLFGFDTEIYRVAWRAPTVTLKERVRYQAARFLTRGILQVDYARGILLVSRRRSSGGDRSRERAGGGRTTPV